MSEAKTKKPVKKAKKKNDEHAASKARFKAKLTSEAFDLAQQAYKLLMAGKLLDARESLYAVVMRLSKVCTL